MSFILGHKRYGIIFDLDNTLVPTSFCYEQAINGVKMILIEKYNITIESASDIVEKYRKLSFVDQPFYEQDKLSVWDWRESLFKQAIEYFTSDGTVDVSAVHKHFSDTFHKYMVIPEQIKMLLRELRSKYKLAILTNGDSKHQRLKLKSCGAEEFFDAIVVSGEHQIYKPDPRIFHIVCRKIGLENRQCIMIGDLLGTDILGSQRAGFKGSVLVEGRDIARLGEIKPDHVIKDVSHLKDVLTTFQFN